MNALPIVDIVAVVSCTPAGTRYKETGPETESVDQVIRLGRPVEIWLIS